MITIDLTRDDIEALRDLLADLKAMRRAFLSLEEIAAMAVIEKMIAQAVSEEILAR